MSDTSDSHDFVPDRQLEEFIEEFGRQTCGLGPLDIFGYITFDPRSFCNSQPALAHLERLGLPITECFLDVCRGNNPELVMWLFKKLDNQGRKTMLQPGVMAACSAGSQNVVQVLIEHDEECPLYALDWVVRTIERLAQPDPNLSAIALSITRLTYERKHDVSEWQWMSQINNLINASDESLIPVWHMIDDHLPKKFLINRVKIRESPRDRFLNPNALGFVKFLVEQGFCASKLARLIGEKVCNEIAEYLVQQDAYLEFALDFSDPLRTFVLERMSPSARGQAFIGCCADRQFADCPFHDELKFQDVAKAAYAASLSSDACYVKFLVEEHKVDLSVLNANKLRSIWRQHNFATPESWNILAFIAKNHSFAANYWLISAAGWPKTCLENYKFLFRCRAQVNYKNYASVKHLVGAHIERLSEQIIRLFLSHGLSRDVLVQITADELRSICDDPTVLWHNVAQIVGENVAVLAALHVDFNSRHGALLAIACRAGASGSVKVMLDRKANPNIGGGKPLMLAAEHGYREICQLLVEHKADVHVGNDAPLYAAVRNGKYLATEYLLQQGANPNAKKNVSALDQAIRSEQVEIAKLLRDHLNRQKNEYVFFFKHGH